MSAYLLVSVDISMLKVEKCAKLFEYNLNSHNQSLFTNCSVLVSFLFMSFLAVPFVSVTDLSHSNVDCDQENNRNKTEARLDLCCVVK